MPLVIHSRPCLGGIALALCTCLPALAMQNTEDFPLEPLSNQAIWRIEFSPITQHYRFSEDHKYVWALGLERQSADRTLFGLTAFSNSFGQPSAYAYYGRVFNNVIPRFSSMYFKVTAGVIYGYKVPFEDKVLFNYDGFSPAIIPAVGWRVDQNWSFQTNFLGTAAIMFMVTRKL